MRLLYQKHYCQQQHKREQYWKPYPYMGGGDPDGRKDWPADQDDESGEGWEGRSVVGDHILLLGVVFVDGEDPGREKDRLSLHVQGVKEEVAKAVD